MANSHGRLCKRSVLIGVFMALSVSTHAQDRSLLQSQSETGVNIGFGRSLELVYLLPADGDGRTRCTVGAGDDSLGGPSAIEKVSGEARWRVVTTDCPDGPGACSEPRIVARGAERWETDENREVSFNLLVGRRRVQRALGAECCAYLLITFDRFVVTESGADPTWTCSNGNSAGCVVGASCRSLDRFALDGPNGIFGTEAP